MENWKNGKNEAWSNWSWSEKKPASWQEKYGDKALPEEFLDLVEGGALPEGWKKTVDFFFDQNKGVSYEEACSQIGKLVAGKTDDTADLTPVKDYIKKFF